MSQASFFKKFFNNADLEVEDLFLLESFQLSYLPGWIPEGPFSNVLYAYPAIRRHLTKKCPEIADFISKVMEDNKPATCAEEVKKAEDELIWTIADLLVYNKCPDVYDSLEFHQWDFNEIMEITPLDEKVVVEGGAGTGKVTFRIAKYAHQVFAVEPVSRLRQYLRDKIASEGWENVFVMDGFLHSIPLPDNFADVLITSHALGWHLEKELPEFERITKPGGFIIHCPGTALSSGDDDPTHLALVSPKFGYRMSIYKEPDGPKRKYWKKINPEDTALSPTTRE